MSRFNFDELVFFFHMGRLIGFLLQIWENYVEGQEAVNGSSVVESKQKEVLKVCCM